MQTRLHPVRRVLRLPAAGFLLEVEGPLPPTAPGQFYMLRPREPGATLLPRPFSLLDRGEDGAWGSFLGKEVGMATRRLARMAQGEGLWLTGPLGNRFPPAQGAEPLCVAGGVGLAPFLLWARERRREGAAPVEVCFGARTADGLAAMQAFPEGLVSWRLATEDASAGVRGTVLELLERADAEGALAGGRPVYCCGPDPMMDAVAAFCAARGLPCRLSLETYMACGYGVCNGCSVRVKGPRFSGWPYAKACTQGPVFDTAELVRGAE